MAAAQSTLGTLPAGRSGAYSASRTCICCVVTDTRTCLCCKPRGGVARSLGEPWLSLNRYRPPFPHADPVYCPTRRENSSRQHVVSPGVSSWAILVAADIARVFLFTFPND